MSEVAVRLDHVYKRFRRGELFNSLRDLVPALIKGVFRRRGERELGEKEFWAIEDVCLEVRAGERLGIIGHNGAGKSTMLKHLAGIMQPTRGSIHVSGRLCALIEIGAGFHPDLTGRENVFLNGIIMGMRRAEIAAKFDEIVAFCELQDFMDTPVKRYSSGMYARLGFSVAAHLDPDILVIDEVLSVGDFPFQAKSMQKILSIARSGATVLFVSHNLKAVSDLCQRTVLMEAGRIVADGPTAEVIETYVDSERLKLRQPKTLAAVIRSVTLRGVNGPINRFEPGETMWVDVGFEAQERCERVAVIIALLGENLWELSLTSTEQMGAAPLNLEPGQRGLATFELRLHLANGTFHVGAYLYRYDAQRMFDMVHPGATFHVASTFDLVGPLHVYPKLTTYAVSG